MSLTVIAAALAISPHVAGAADFPREQSPAHSSLMLARSERPDREIGPGLTGGTVPIDNALATGRSGELAPRMVELFDLSRDILCAHFDTKPDLNDVHAQAAVGSVVANPDLSGIDVFAVVGAYGEQDGEFVESFGVMELAFPGNWTSTTGEGYSWAAAVEQSAVRMAAAIDRGGDVWIAEAGQSGFSHDAIQAGGFDFSDASEVCHIFGMGKPLIDDHADFFDVFVP